MVKEYRKIYYTNQLRVFETDTKYKTIGVRLLTGESSFDSANIAILAQGQVDMNSLLDSFLDETEVYSEDFFLTVRIFRWSYSVSFTVYISAPSISFLVNQFMSFYGFDTEGFYYEYTYIDFRDLWYLVYYYSNVQCFSLFKSAKTVLNYFTSRSNFRIEFFE